MNIRALRFLTFAVLACASLLGTNLAAAEPDPRQPAGAPDFGPNVIVFDPSMSTSQIHAVVDPIAAQQIPNQFGTQRYALLFKPGTYGSSTDPLNFQVGYYTTVAGLGRLPTDTVINGTINVYNQCTNGSCVALNNFWRSLENLTINVTDIQQGCPHVAEFWAVSQAAPMRRVQINGLTTLMDFCTPPSFASGGFIADSQFTGSTVINGSQQQWLVRNSNLDGWTNAVWNQVFSGVVNAPAQCFPAQSSCGGPYTTITTSPVTREAPFLYIDAAGKYQVFVPDTRRNTSGTSWANGPDAGRSISLDEFFIARPADSENRINEALARGRNLILTPGVYNLHRTLNVRRENSVLLGLGIPTLVPQTGLAAMSVGGGASGADLEGILFDAGPVNSPVLLQVGDEDDGGRDSANPIALHDVFFRIGGATPGKATTSLVVNTNNTLLDDLWIWRADHGNGVGWTSNTADTGLVVNGTGVTAYGLFVEHFQKFEVIWNGEDGTVIFFQNEMPYDPPSQAAWMEAPGVDGFAAFKVSDRVRTFRGFGMGSYSFFNQGIDIFAAHAFEVPTSLPTGTLHDLLTIFLDAVHGKGGILHVVNDAGGSSTAANADQVVPVVSYP
jgi:hypothetical protein